MDDWCGPQFVNFNSSTRSNTDEDFFDSSHKLRISDGTQYDSCADSTNASTAYGTPRTSSTSNRTPARCSRESILDGSLSSAMSPLRLRSETINKIKLSSTPNAFRRLKIGAHTVNSPMSNVIEKSNDTTEKTKYEASSAENLVSSENTDEEYDKNNRTLVADEYEKSFTLPTLILEELEAETKFGIVNAEASLSAFPKSDIDHEILDRNDDEYTENELIMSPLKLSKDSIHDENEEDLPNSSGTEINVEIISEDVKSPDEIVNKISELVDQSDSEIHPNLDDGNEEKISIPLEISTNRTENPHKEELSTEEKTKLENLVARLDPPKRRMVDKKNPTSIAAKPRVLTSQVRRYSLSKYRRRSNQYIGLAEAVAKFQYGTPERFRSKPKTDKNAGPLPKRVKQTATKATYAVSPVLLSKLRVRAVAMPTSEKTATTTSSAISKKILKKPSTESLMGKKPLPNAPKSLPKSSSSSSVDQKITASRPKVSTNSVAPTEVKTATNTSKIRAKSVAHTEPKTSTNRSKIRTNSVGSTESKTSTKSLITRDNFVSSTGTKMQLSKKQFKSFVRTERKKWTNVLAGQTKSVTSTEVISAAEIPEATTTSNSEIKTAMNPPKVPSDSLAIPVASSSQKSPMKPSSALGDSFIAGDKKNLSRRSRTPCKKVISAAVSLYDNEHGLKDVEIINEGIPINTKYRNKNITRPMPFSFETRKKESNNKKDELKDENKEIADEKTKKIIFHARPSTSFVKGSSTTTKTSSTALKPKDDNMNAARTLSFQERNELLIQKKKKCFDEVLEKEKKARIFHAKPAPNFKPVFVRGASAENLRSNADDNNAAKDNKAKIRGLSPAARGKGLSQDSLVSNQENKAPNVANQQCPKFKNPVIVQNFKIKKTMEK